MNYLTTSAAAEALGINTSRVRQLILAGRLKSVKIGRDHMIDPAALDAVRERKITGRPPAKRPAGRKNKSKNKLDKS